MWLNTEYFSISKPQSTQVASSKFFALFSFKQMLLSQCPDCNSGHHKGFILISKRKIPTTVTNPISTGTRMSQSTTGTFGTLPTHFTAYLKRWRMKRSSMMQPAAALEGIRAPAPGSSPWCPSSNLSSSRSSWLANPCSYSRTWTARTRNSRRDRPGVSVLPLVGFVDLNVHWFKDRKCCVADAERKSLYTLFLESVQSRLCSQEGSPADSISQQQATTRSLIKMQSIIAQHLEIDNIHDPLLAINFAR